MSGRFLLDTNIIIALFANDPLVLEKLERAEEVFVSSITIGELYYGAYSSNRIADNIARIQEFASRNTILVSDLITAQYYGQIKNTLKAKGRPLPENDIWIAAIAQQYQLALVSRDKHFREIDNLSVETW